METSTPVSDRTFAPWTFHSPIRRALTRPARLLDWCGPLPGETVLDLGAGGGYFLPELQRRVGPSGRVYAVDVDARALALAERLDRERPSGVPTRFFACSAASVPAVPSGSVDFVLANGLLCCMVDKAGALDEIWRVLRPGGTAVLTFETVSPGWTARSRALRLTELAFRQMLAAHRWRLTEGPRRRLGRAFRVMKPGEPTATAGASP